VGAWLVTVARSRGIDRIRSEGSRQRAETSAGVDPPAPTEDASANAAHRQMSERVGRALEKLGPQHRQVVELAYFGGLTQGEIAERLNAPLGTVKSWTRQALLRLSDLVPQEEWT
jgi:RNA polymerase sigma-70 factor (ECF subfamily)